MTIGQGGGAMVTPVSQSCLFPHRRVVCHRDLGPDGVLEAEQLCGECVLRGDEGLLQLRGRGSGMLTAAPTHSKRSACPNENMLRNTTGP